MKVNNVYQCNDFVRGINNVYDDIINLLTRVKYP